MGGWCLWCREQADVRNGLKELTCSLGALITDIIGLSNIPQPVVLAT